MMPSILLDIDVKHSVISTFNLIIIAKINCVSNYIV